jgi:signal transduction histidine kinase
MTNAEMLNDNSYNGNDRNGFAKNILSTSKRMRGLVESLLELARLDNNRTPLKLSTVDMSRLINDSILPFEPLFYENDMSLSADIDSDIKVQGDKDKLRQVVNILLDNALKYSDPSDKVTVKLKCHGSECILSVSGRGTMLTKEERENIFKRFYRVDKARNDGQSYGLGLSIADSIIREHNGKIWAGSADGYNTFYVSLQM